MPIPLQGPTRATRRRLLRPRFRWRVATITLFALGVIVACKRDTVTAPPHGAEPPTAAPSFDVDPAPPLPAPEGSTVPYGFTLTVAIPDPVNGSVPQTKIGDITRRIVGTMTLRQFVTQSGGGRDPYTAGPRGRYVTGFWDERCILWSWMGYRYANGTGYLDDLKPSAWGCAGTNVSGEQQETSPWLYWLVPGATVYGGRAGGSAHLCGSNCYTFGGSTTYIFTPTTNVVQVTPTPEPVAGASSASFATSSLARVPRAGAVANASAAASASFVEGSPVKFTASRADGGVVSSVESWIWRPRDPSAPVRTVACETTSTICTTPVFEDGWMFAHVVIDGYLHTAYAGITVTPARVIVTASMTTPTYGDSVRYTASPEPAGAPDFVVTGWKFVPDSTGLQPIPPVCSDTTCTDIARISGSMWVVATLAGRTDSGSVHIDVRPPDLVVDCPATVARGDSIACTIRLSRPVPFTITRRDARSQYHSITSRPNSSHAAGEMPSWRGLAAVATHVDVTVRLSTGAVISQTGSFDVSARTWDVWQLTQRPDIIKGIRSSMRMTGASFEPANFQFYGVDSIDAVARTRIIRAGPDSGLAFLATQPGLLGSDIYYHPDLYSGSAWYKDQNGKPANTCKATHVALLWTHLRRHEGETQHDSSHYGVTNRVLRQSALHATVEAFVMRTGSAHRLVNAVLRRVDEWGRNTYKPEQDRFDTNDDPIPGVTGVCAWDLKPGAP